MLDPNPTDGLGSAKTGSLTITYNQLNLVYISVHYDIFKCSHSFFSYLSLLYSCTDLKELYRILLTYTPSNEVTSDLNSHVK